MLKYHYAKVFAPATVSNCGPGFDVFGFALQNPGDIIELKAVKRNGIKITKITGDKGKISNVAKRNTAGAALISMMNAVNGDFGLDVIIRKQMPLASGLGSSAASAVGAVVALNALLKRKLSQRQLLIHAIEGEKIASGNSAHADNVAPALFGGFVIVRSMAPIDIISIPYPKNLHCLVVYPHIEIKTADARKILPMMLNRQDAVKQCADAAAFIAGLMMNDTAVLSRSMTDHIAEPYRRQFIPMYDDIRKIIIENGALNCNISGSGPSMFGFFTDPIRAEITSIALNKFLRTNRVKSIMYVSDISRQGAKVLERR